jgi:hypothetical protein
MVAKKASAPPPASSTPSASAKATSAAASSSTALALAGPAAKKARQDDFAFDLSALDASSSGDQIRSLYDDLAATHGKITNPASDLATLLREAHKSAVAATVAAEEGSRHILALVRANGTARSIQGQRAAALLRKSRDMEKHDEELAKAREELAQVSMQRDKLAENLRTALATIQQLRAASDVPAASHEPAPAGTPSSSSSVRISTDLATALSLAADAEADEAANPLDGGSGEPQHTEGAVPSTPPSESPKTDTDAEADVPSSSSSAPDEDAEGKDDAHTDDDDQGAAAAPSCSLSWCLPLANASRSATQLCIFMSHTV